MKFRSLVFTIILAFAWVGEGRAQALQTLPTPAPIPNTASGGQRSAPRPAQALSPPVPFLIGPVDTPDTLNARITVPVPGVLPSIATPNTSQPVQPLVPTPVPTTARSAGCGGGTLGEMLSPSCLDTLGSLSPGMGKMPSLSIPGVGVSCSVSMLVSGHASATSFQVPDLGSCLQVGTRLGWGIAGMTNIVAVSASGISSVICVRSLEAPSAVTCRPQP